MQERNTTRLAVGLLVATLSSCAVTNPPSSYISQAVTPNPVVAQLSTDGNLQYSAAFTITFTESGGVGAGLTSLTTTVYESTGGVLTAVLDTTNSHVEATLAGNRIAANGTLSIAYKLSFTLPGGGHTALVRVLASFVDDQGVAYSGSVDVPIS